MTAVWNGHSTCHHRTYRIDCTQYDRMLRRANDHCEICGIHVSQTPDNRLGIDHDHRAGTGWNHVRGMLCSKCNCNLKYAERGDRAFTVAERAYMARAWCVLEPPRNREAEPSTDLVNITVAVPRDLRNSFAQVIRVTASNRSEVMSGLLGWYLRRPGAKLPTRPPRSESGSDG